MRNTSWSGLVAVFFCWVTIAIASAQTLTTLHSFNDSDGVLPKASLMQGSDGNLYGTATEGGSKDRGTVFKVTPSGTLTVLHSFCSDDDCADGFDPRATLVEGADGSLYGTTLEGGGKVSAGTIFKITPGGKLTTLYRFCAEFQCPDGELPSGLVQGSDGSFYGTTQGGGPPDSGAVYDGTVFKINSTGAFSTVYTFFCSRSS